MSNKTLTAKKKIITLYNLLKPAKTIIFLAGRVINRKIISYDRKLLNNNGFILFKANNFQLSNVLKKFDILNNLANGIAGYNFVAYNRRKKNSKKIDELFYLPYKNIAPYYALASRTYYSPARFAQNSLNSFHLKHISSLCGTPVFFILINAINNFIYSKIKMLSNT